MLVGTLKCLLQNSVLYEVDTTPINLPFMGVERKGIKEGGAIEETMAFKECRKKLNTTAAVLQHYH